MTKSRLFQVIGSLSIVVFFICSQPALAQHHLQMRVVPGTGAHHPGVKPLAGFDELFQLSTGFGALPPVDGGGNDEWPCFAASTNPNAADCSQIAAGGVVIGTPAYTWSYAACDANTATSPNCGQIFWFYEDDTNDNTDPLVVSLVVKQGTKTILNTGNVTLADPNPYPAGSVIVIYDDTAFGTLGQTGKGNGFCAGTKTTCVDPLKGVATVMVTTKVGASKISSKFNINFE
jgi:hypothetical protein